MKNRHQRDLFQLGVANRGKTNLKFVMLKGVFFPLLSSRLKGSVAVALAHIQVAVEGFESKQTDKLVTVCGAQWVGFTLFNP